jgi:hypothetical protein
MPHKTVGRVVVVLSFLVFLHLWGDDIFSDRLTTIAALVTAALVIRSVFTEPSG